jgi:Xaa-Pro aminopeptidase
VFGKIKRLIRPGVTELDIAAEISYLHRQLGGERDAFEPIVASGRRSALPHARATGKRIKHGDLVILDFGCSVNGYHSDITRTMVVGRASGEARRMHAAVLSASDEAIKSARAGMPAKELDRVARKEITGAGMAKYFVHALGHGLGIQVHERPRISALSKDILKAGNVVTIEPGVYIPSVGGVRIEDDVLITKSGCEVLSHTSKELFVA